MFKLWHFFIVVLQRPTLLSSQLLSVFKFGLTLQLFHIFTYRLNMILYNLSKSMWTADPGVSCGSGSSERHWGRWLVLDEVQHTGNVCTDVTLCGGTLSCRNRKTPNTNCWHAAEEHHCLNVIVCRSRGNRPGRTDVSLNHIMMETLGPIKALIY